MKRTILGISIAGVCAGAVNGLFGAAGGMVLIPLLTLLTDLKGSEIFSASLCIMLPICLISLGYSAVHQGLAWKTALPYLIGGTIGGWIAGKYGANIPVRWLHKGFGLLILWGGIRYLW